MSSASIQASGDIAVNIASFGRRLKGRPFSPYRISCAPSQPPRAHSGDLLGNDQMVIIGAPKVPAHVLGSSLVGTGRSALSAVAVVPLLTLDRRQTHCLLDAVG